MKISIVTCTWNSEPYLAESIASVISQNYTNIEYIFVDGGSTDGTLDRIAAIPRQIKVLHDVRGGISNAMNEGWRVATGDIVAHLHSDDYYLHPNVLTEVANAMSNNNGWCYGRIVRDINGKQVAENYTAPTYSYARLLRGNFIPHPATFVRRDWLQQLGGFSVARKYAMDYDLWLRMGKLGDPIALGTPLAAFRMHDGSLSTRNRLAAMAEDYAVRKHYLGSNPLRLFEAFARYTVRRHRAVVDSTTSTIND